MQKNIRYIDKTYWLSTPLYAPLARDHWISDVIINNLWTTTVLMLSTTELARMVSEELRRRPGLCSPSFLSVTFFNVIPRLMQIVGLPRSLTSSRIISSEIGPRGKKTLLAFRWSETILIMKIIITSKSLTILRCSCDFAQERSWKSAKGCHNLCHKG